MSEPRYKVGDKLRIKAEYRPSSVCPCGTIDAYPTTDYIVILAVGSTYSYEIYDELGNRLATCSHCLRDIHLEYYSNGEPDVSKRTFKLLKDSPSMLKGALLQEQTDGTSPYIMLNQETHALDPSYKISFAKRELVEDQPKWFVEVFAVEPQFMTREELDQFELFKTTKVTKKKATKK